jgi:hypothetical protein
MVGEAGKIGACEPIGEFFKGTLLNDLQKYWTTWLLSPRGAHAAHW